MAFSLPVESSEAPGRRARQLRRRLLRTWRIVGATMVLMLYFLLAPFGYAVFALLALIPNRNPDRRAQRLQNILRSAFSLMFAVLRALRLIHYDPRELEGSLPHQPCVLVANHPTLVDVAAVYAAVAHVASAVKPQLFYRFWAHPLLHQAAQFAGTGGNPLLLSGMMDAAVDRLSRGYHVLVFPEGTRSPASGLGVFGRSAFAIATRARVPVVPVVIECEPRWLSKDHSFFRPPASAPHLRLRLLEPVKPEQVAFCSRTLRKVVSAAIAAQLQPGATANQ